jgi:hypothetical protein
MKWIVNIDRKIIATALTSYNCTSNTPFFVENLRQNNVNLNVVKVN